MSSTGGFRFEQIIQSSLDRATEIVCHFVQCTLCEEQHVPLENTVDIDTLGGIKN